MAVARLFFTDPAKYGRSCEDCRRWQYDERTGRPAQDKTKRLADGTPDPDARLPRPRAADPPCHDCGKTAGLEPARRHWRFGPPDPPAWCYRSFRHWAGCEAVGWAVPEAADPIVRRNSELFRLMHDGAEKGERVGILTALGIIKKG